MSVSIYSQLDRLLRERQLTISELEREIEQRYGLVVAAGALDHLAHADPVERADLKLAAATAAILGVGLADLFEVEVVPVDPAPPEGEAYLHPRQRARFAELLDIQSRRELTTAERAELDRLLDEYGAQVEERHDSAYACQRDISIEQARREAEAEVARVAALWANIDASPRLRQAYLARSRRRETPTPPR